MRAPARYNAQEALGVPRAACLFWVTSTLLDGPLRRQDIHRGCRAQRMLDGRETRDILTGNPELRVARRPARVP